MLSVAAVSAGAASSGYYSNDSYYAKDSEEAKEASVWHGEGAAAAGLSGHVDPGKFSEIMQGFTPDERRLGYEKNGEHVHQAGTDMTFSAPKSVSVMALLSGDKRIVTAHDAAVKTALDYAEKTYLQTRMKDPITGKVERLGGQKMIAGVFRHDSSRALDPQLHSHAVVANMTIGEDGKWRTVQNNAFFKNKMEIGAVYRNALASSLTEIGYDIWRAGKHGFVEIKGVPKDLERSFSTRSEEIKAALKSSYDAKLSAAAARAAILTRSAKSKSVDRAELYALWRKEAAAKGFGDREMASIRDSAKGRSILSEDRSIEARAAVEFAVRHVSERASVYEKGHIVKTALDRMQRGTIADVSREIERRLETGQLISSVHKSMQSPITDARSLHTERSSIDAFKASTNVGTVIAKQRVVDRAIYRTSLSDGQKNAVSTALSTKDRVVGVQGYAGTGKTFMLSKVKAIAEKQGYEIVGLAPAHRAVKELGAAGIEGNTLHSFVSRNERFASGRAKRGDVRSAQREFAKKVLVVDEASMIGTRQMRDFLTIANRVGAAKVVLVGDVKQLDAVEAGSPFRALQNAGMDTASMADIMRQRNPEMLGAIHDIIQNEVAEFFNKIDNRIEEVERPALAAANRWLSLSPEERANTMLITQKNSWRAAINDRIREGLREEGAVGRDDVRFERLDPQRLTTAQLGVADNYQPGDVVIFEKTVRSIGAKMGDSFTVIDRQSSLDLVHEGAPFSDGKIALRDDKTGREVEYEPGRSTWFANAVSLYERGSIDLAVGDAIRFDRTDLDEKIVNKAMGEIVSLDDKTVTINIGDEVKTLPRDHPLTRHMDYAWAATVHGSQGATVENAIVAIEAASALTTQKSLYVAASRIKEDVTLFTEDRVLLKNTVMRESGERLDARDIVPDERAANEGRDLNGRELELGQAAPLDADRPDFEADPLTARDPILTPEQEAAWRAQIAEVNPADDLQKGDEEMRMNDHEDADRSRGEDRTEERRPEDPATPDDDHDEVREAERPDQVEERQEEPEPFREEPGEDRAHREENRHGFLDRGETERGDDTRDAGLDRGDDGEMER
ncbi:MAG: MobF family relaxase [Pseudomonadota bacterium]